jgi:hypothetical protein
MSLVFKVCQESEGFAVDFYDADGVELLTGTYTDYYDLDG